MRALWHSPVSSSCEFEVIQPFQISDRLTIFQGYGLGHRFVVTLPYIIYYINASRPQGHYGSLLFLHDGVPSCTCSF